MGEYNIVCLIFDFVGDLSEIPKNYKETILIKIWVYFYLKHKENWNIIIPKNSYRRIWDGSNWKSFDKNRIVKNIDINSLRFYLGELDDSDESDESDESNERW